jgi:hypothetical protein
MQQALCLDIWQTLEPLWYLLGKRAGGHRDSKIEAHPQMQILMNLHSGTKVAIHLRTFFAGSSHLRWSPGIGGRSSWRSSPCRRHQCGEEAEAEIIDVPEVLSADDVTRWTRVTSSFVGHRNICKSQMIVMTL